MDNQEPETIGGRIRAKRQRLHWRIADLSERVGVTAGFLSKIELNQARFPSDSILYRIAIELGLDPLELIGIKEQNKVAKTNKQEREIQAHVEKVVPLPRPFLGHDSILQDTVSAVTEINSPQPFQEEFMMLAQAYVALGLRCCTTPDEDGVLEYHAGLAAYQAAAVFYRRAGSLDALRELSYRMARTYQNLVVTDRVQSEERLFFLYRAVALADQAYAGNTNRDQEEDNFRGQRLKAAGLAIGAAVNKLIAVELRAQGRREGFSPDQWAALQVELDTLSSAANARRIQAEVLYSQIINGLEVKRSMFLDPVQDWKTLSNVLFDAADVTRLKAINWRGKETGQYALLMPERLGNDRDKGRHNLERSLAALHQAVDSQRRGLQLLEMYGAEDKDFTTTQARMRRLLANFHQEWGSTFSQSNQEDWFAQCLWQLGLSQKVCPSAWRRDEYTAGDQFIAEFINNMQSDALDADRDDLELRQRVLAADIRSRLESLEKSGDFTSLDYPLTYDQSEKKKPPAGTGGETGS